MQERNYSCGEIQYDQLKQHILLPKFQRSLVWSQDQQEAFIETVKSGNPFGCFLLYKTIDEKYEIIDGLQRYTALREYENNPAKYLNLTTENYPSITAIAKILQDNLPRLSIESLEQKIILCIREVLNEIPLNEIGLCRDIRKNIVSHYGGEAISQAEIEKIEDHLIVMIKSWSSDINFRDLVIPAIIYKGSKSDLPEIFDRLNNGGTKLSRYEVFASTWSSIVLLIKREEYLDSIEDLYKKKCEKTGLTISNYKEGLIKESKQLSLYELCFAFGKKIIKSCKTLFKAYPKKDDDAVDSIGFTSLATILGIPLTELADLHLTVNNQTNIDNLIRLMDLIVVSYQKVERILKNYISTVDEKVFTKFIEAQVLAIVSTHFRMYHIVNADLSVSDNIGVSKKIKDDFTKFMPYAYLYEILSEYWAGTGDKKLAEQIKLPIEEIKYISYISKEKWRNLLYDWMDKQISDKKKSVTIENKLFLNFISKTRVDWHDSTKRYDIEHIVPKKRIKDRNIDVAVSAIGNLCLLPEFDNRRKKEETIYEYHERSQISVVDLAAIDKLYYPTKDELSFIRSRSDFSVENYNRFLKERNNYLLEAFLKLVD